MGKWAEPFHQVQKYSKIAKKVPKMTVFSRFLGFFNDFSLPGFVRKIGQKVGIKVGRRFFTSSAQLKAQIKVGMVKYKVGRK